MKKYQSKRIIQTDNEQVGAELIENLNTAQPLLLILKTRIATDKSLLRIQLEDEESIVSSLKSYAMCPNELDNVLDFVNRSIKTLSVAKLEILDEVERLKRSN